MREAAENADGVRGTESGGAETAEGGGEIFFFAQEGGEILAAVAAFQVGLDEGDFVGFGEGFADGVGGDGSGDAALAEVAEDALGAEAFIGETRVSEGFGEAFVVQEAAFAQVVDERIDGGGVGGAELQFLADFMDGEGAAAEQSEGVLAEGGRFEEADLSRGHSHSDSI